MKNIPLLMIAMLAVEGGASSQELAVAVSPADSDQNSDPINGLQNEIIKKIGIIKNELLQPLRLHIEIPETTSRIPDLENEAKSIVQLWKEANIMCSMYAVNQFRRLHAEGPSSWLRDRNNPWRPLWDSTIRPEDLNTGLDLVAYLREAWIKWGSSIEQAMANNNTYSVFNVLNILKKWNGDPTRTISAKLDEISDNIHAFYDEKSLKKVSGLLDIFSTIVNTYNDRYEQRAQLLKDKWAVDMSQDQGFVEFNDRIRLAKQRSEQLSSAEQLDRRGDEAQLPPDVSTKAFFDMVEKSQDARIAIQHKFEALANSVQPIRFIHLGILPIEVAVNRILDAVKCARTLSNEKNRNSSLRDKLFLAHNRDLPKLVSYLQSEDRLKQFEPMVPVLNEINGGLGLIKGMLRNEPVSITSRCLRYGTESLNAMHNIVALRRDVMNTKARLQNFNPHFSAEATQQLIQSSPKESSQYSWLCNHEHPDLDIQSSDPHRKQILAVRKGKWIPSAGVSPSAEVAMVLLEEWFARWQRSIIESTTLCSTQLCNLLNTLELEKELPVVTIEAIIDGISANLGQFDDVNSLRSVLDNVSFVSKTPRGNKNPRGNLRNAISQELKSPPDYLQAPIRWQNARTKKVDASKNQVYINAMAFLNDLKQTCGGALPELLSNEINEKQKLLFSIQDKYIDLFNTFKPIALDRSRFDGVKQILDEFVIDNKIELLYPCF
ncbi:MAG: hypothetical protein LBR89_00795 [Holosporales bacterium]|jgi:hypothetical protein|nr:hypothetical protein [Holosporales bacterium]